MSDSAVDTFIQEAQELLESMEQALLAMEEDPDDDSHVNAIFRAAHTIKGTGGVFGFDFVEKFTHVVENILDNVRQGDLKIDSGLIALLLQAKDHMEVLVEAAAVTQQDPDEETLAQDAILIKQLQQYLSGTASTEGVQAEGSKSEESLELEAATGSSSEVEKVTDGKPVASENWHISLRFDPEALQHGMDPLSFLRYLQKMGEIVNTTTITDNLPGYEDLEPLHCYLGFEIEFNSDATKEKIEQVFEFVRELSTINILPPQANISEYAGFIDALDDENLRVGEILVASGALTQRELDEALAIQNNETQGISNEPKAKIGEVLVENKVVQKEVVNAAVKKQGATREKLGGGSKVLRVDAEKLDDLINLVGELVISGATTNLLAARLADEDLLESMSQMSRLVEDIRDSALTLRMVQIGETFNRFKRVVRDVSKELGKDIQLEINGADTELDKTVIEKIGDPLMHLVRNAMDHGIETNEERALTDKPAKGTLTLNAFHESGSIVIEVEDDGRGLDRDKILAKALEKNLIADGQALTDHEIYKLVLEAGFSTADQVTNLSGRGVGMDVVKRNVEALRGSIDITSEAGAGSKVSIRLPLTLAIIDGFMVGVGESCYVIPLDMVIECIEMDDADTSGNSEQGYINLRGEVLPFIQLGELFEETGKQNSHQNIVVVEFAGYKAGIVVDELLGEFQTVIKPMGKILQEVRGVSGATILGTGDVAVILDIPNLVQRVVQHTNQLGRTNVDSRNLH